MAVTPVGHIHHAEIEHLFRNGRHIYTSQPTIDLNEILKNQTSVIGIDNGSAWGFASIENETRPKTLASSAPSRAYLAQVAIADGRSPYTDVPELISVLLESLPPHGNLLTRLSLGFRGKQKALPKLLIYSGRQQWLVKPLQQAGFAVAKRVEFLTLDHLQRRLFPIDHSKQMFPLRPAHHSDLNAIAQLDAQAFTPLWHLGPAQLRELWTSHRIYVACDGRKVIGYTAIALVGIEGTETSGEGHAHLARIATAQEYRGKGLGKRLLVDTLEFAQEQGAESVTLNTQTDNEPARELYRTMGFRPTGEIYPVLTLLVE